MKATYCLVLTILTLVFTNQVQARVSKDEKCNSTQLIQQIGNEAVQVLINENYYDKNGLDKLEIQRFISKVKRVKPVVTINRVTVTDQNSNRFRDSRHVSAKNNNHGIFFSFADWERYSRDPLLAIKLVLHEYMGHAMIDDSGYQKSSGLADFIFKNRSKDSARMSLESCASKKVTEKDENSLRYSDSANLIRTDQQQRKIGHFYNAIANGKLDQIDADLASGVSIHDSWTTQSLTTPLHQLFTFSFEDAHTPSTARFLLERGADPDAYNGFDQTASMWVLTILRARLGERNANRTALVGRAIELLMLLRQYDANLTLPSNADGGNMPKGTTLLMLVPRLAIFVNVSEITDYLLQYNFNLNKQTDEGATALMQAFLAVRPMPEYVQDYFDKLLHYQKEINLELVHFSNGTVLMQAIDALYYSKAKSKKKSYYIDALLGSGAKVCTEFNGKTALTLAKQYKLWSVFKKLKRSAIKNKENCYKRKRKVNKKK